MAVEEVAVVEQVREWELVPEQVRASVLEQVLGWERVSVLERALG